MESVCVSLCWIATQIFGRKRILATSKDKWHYTKVICSSQESPLWYEEISTLTITSVQESNGVLGSCSSLHSILPFLCKPPWLYHSLILQELRRASLHFLLCFSSTFSWVSVPGKWGFCTNQIFDLTTQKKKMYPDHPGSSMTWCNTHTVRGDLAICHRVLFKGNTALFFNVIPYLLTPPWKGRT